MGRDRKKDNLATFSDSHSYCFSCGYYIKGNGLSSFKHKHVEKPEINFNIPVDAELNLPAEAYEWLKSFHITYNDIISNKILWSEKLKWLIFPIEHNNAVVGFQARNFNKDKPYKWFTRFDKKDYIIPFGKGNTIVLVEDILSAIRVGHEAISIPLFGSFISDALLQHLKKQNKPTRIWLDRNKASESILYAAKARSIGINATVLITDLDPKEYTKEEICRYLQR